MIALVLADFATYSALRSSLYKQDDQSLAQTSRADDAFSMQRSAKLPTTDFLSVVARPGGAASRWRRRRSERIREHPLHRGPDDQWPRCRGRQCSAYVGSTKYSPQLPTQITGFSTQPDGPQIAYFTRGLDHEWRSGLPRAGDRRAT